MIDWRARLQLSASELLKGSNTILAIVLWALAVYYAYTQRMPRALFATSLFGLAFVIYIVEELADSFDDRDWLDVYTLFICFVVIVVTTAYLLINFDVLLFTRTGTGYHYEYMLALVFTLAMFYLINRAFGLAFLGVIGGGALYAWLGAHLPGILGHGGLSLTRILNVFVLDFDGFFGSITGIVAAWVSLFLLYAGLLRGYGAFDYVMRIAFRAANYIESGVAQSAVISSLLVGSINGAQTANAAMTGSITIPLMKESGLKSSTAAGIEAVASSGGQIMPPVMGAAAFIMASILGITYFEVLVAGIIPALVFYLAVAVAVHYTSVNQGIGENSTLDVDEKVGERKSRAQFAIESIKLGIPFAILIYTLGIIQYTVMTAALYTAVAMVVTGVTFPLVERAMASSTGSAPAPTRLWNGIKLVARQTVVGLRYGAITFAPIAIIVAAINAIVDVFVTTGVPGKLALALMDLSGGILIVALVLAMIICIILGLGMPTVAAYTIVALLVAPALIENFGLTRLTVHYFVFYAAILSGITPPIAIAVVVTTGIAESNFWASAIESVKIAAPLFVLPFAFIYNPEIIVGGLTLGKVVSATLLLFGAAIMVHGLNYFRPAFDGRLGNMGLRLLFVVFGTVIMAAPTELLRIGALLVAAVVMAFQLTRVHEIPISAVPTTVRRRF